MSSGYAVVGSTPSGSGASHLNTAPETAAAAARSAAADFDTVEANATPFLVLLTDIREGVR